MQPYAMQMNMPPNVGDKMRANAVTQIAYQLKHKKRRRQVGNFRGLGKRSWQYRRISIYSRTHI